MVAFVLQQFMGLDWGLVLSPKELFNLSFILGKSLDFLEVTGYTWPHPVSLCQVFTDLYAFNIVTLTWMIYDTRLSHEKTRITIA